VAFIPVLKTQQFSLEVSIVDFENKLSQSVLDLVAILNTFYQKQSFARTFTGFEDFAVSGVDTPNKNHHLLLHFELESASL
jgi:hypothetical protein